MLTVELSAETRTVSGEITGTLYRSTRVADSASAARWIVGQRDTLSTREHAAYITVRDDAGRIMTRYHYVKRGSRYTPRLK